MKTAKQLVGNAIGQTRVSSAETEPRTIASRHSATSRCPEFVHRFETFNEKGLNELLAAAQRFASEIWHQSRQVTLRGQQHVHSPGRWLTMLGSNGNGKTHLAHAISRFVRYECCEYECPATMAMLFRDRIFRDWRILLPELYDGAFAQLQDQREAWFLTIDDLWSSADPRNLGASITEALATREGRWTVLTSNKSLEDIGQIDRRLASRMRRFGEVIQIDTTDFSLRRETP